MLIAILGCFFGFCVIGFTHLDVLNKNKKLGIENTQLKKEVALLSEAVIKEYI